MAIYYINATLYPVDTSSDLATDIALIKSRLIAKGFSLPQVVLFPLTGGAKSYAAAITVTSNETVGVLSKFKSALDTDFAVYGQQITNSEVSTNTNDNTLSYTVKSGDTLGKIAAKFNTTVAALAALNGITKVNLIRIGQVLRISGNAPVTTTNLPVVTQPNQNNTTPVNNPFIPPPNPQPQNKEWYAPFYENKKITAIGIMTIILAGGLILMSEKGRR